jgi:citrate lyase subunit beta/citryl-CoA lyase
VVPKVECASDLEKVDWVVSNLESERGIEVGSIDIVPIIETARGLGAIDEIARSGTRVRRLSFGGGDFTRDMGIKWSGAEAELAYARSRFVLASRVAGLEQPIDTVFIDLADNKHFDLSVETAVTFGFQGKLCIHPKQIARVNEGFSPSELEVKRATEIIKAFEESENTGSASIQVNGYFVDYPIVEKARRVVSMDALVRSSKV